ncbi:MAG TPA: TIGR00730 family Rossman fold protein [candidate division Zixibacteria bacterium]|nr:TIGR00730 family Rossman fold protein [candidate division Zixibacteria bacterium]
METGGANAILSEVESRIRVWLQDKPAGGNETLIAEMLQTVLKLAGDNASRGDLKILNRALKELRYAFKVFAPYRSVRKVSMFGSTRVTEEDPLYRLARALGRRLADEGFMVITGAGPGIMQAGHEGAGREKSFGVNIRLPLAQKANRVIQDDAKLVTFRFFFTRKLMFVKEADAFVFFPGGYGTLDELIEVLTLAQTGKSQLVPILLMDLPDKAYWTRWESFVRDAMLSRGYVHENELSFFEIVTDPVEAVETIKRYYSNYHSYRFVRQDLVIRLQREPSDRLIETLNREFTGILNDGGVRRTGPLPEEADEPSTLQLHRLLVHFNRRDFATLRKMIDVINRDGGQGRDNGAAQDRHPEHR